MKYLVLALFGVILLAEGINSDPIFCFKSREVHSNSDECNEIRQECVHENLPSGLASRNVDFGPGNHNDPDPCSMQVQQESCGCVNEHTHIVPKGLPCAGEEYPFTYNCQKCIEVAYQLLRMANPQTK